MTEKPDERGKPNGRHHRRDSIGIRVRYAVAIIVALIAAYAATQAHSTAQQAHKAARLATAAAAQANRTAEAVKADVQNQTASRALNVAVWCQAINQDRAYNRRFVARVTHGTVTYSLGNLDCRALERATLASTK